MKVAVINKKLKMLNLVESMRNQIHDRRVENMELQASVAPAQRAPLRSPNSAESINFKNNISWTSTTCAMKWMLYEIGLTNRNEEECLNLMTIDELFLS